MNNIYLIVKHIAQNEYVEPETGAQADDSTEILEAFDDMASAQKALDAYNQKAKEEPWTYDDPDKSDPRNWEIITLPIIRSNKPS